MASVDFPYHNFPHPPTSVFGQNHTCWRPLVITAITGSAGMSFRCITWPDSGADHCVFPVSFANAMGLDILQMPKQVTQGVGGSSVTYYDRLTIDLGHGISFQTLAGFTPGLETQGLGLLGQVGFFENFAVTFLHKKRIFSVSPHE